MEFKHESVMLEETVSLLITRHDGIYIDGTIGGAGHTMRILKELSGEARMLGIDRDIEALNAAKARTEAAGYSVELVKDNFCNIKEILKKKNIEKITGAMIDLGVSSYQLDNPERGFSYMNDAPLDMRMDASQYKSAYHVVNDYSEWQLYSLIRDYGEENWAKRIAQFIVAARENGAIETTGQLVKIIEAAIPAAARKNGGHPAKRTFQAIRIEVNDELRHLEQAVRDFVDVLEEGGRLCVLTFHSLEDRIVKRVFRELENPCTCAPEAPICVCGKKPSVKILTKRPLIASEEELNNNSRSKSAKLRAVQKV